ncbi:hypothetical protein KM043_009701 [Ampulex compressa]|nr:hypothetical protein KM043_009701 [Ampulex compressa]
MRFRGRSTDEPKRLGPLLFDFAEDPPCGRHQGRKLALRQRGETSIRWRLRRLDEFRLISGLCEDSSFVGWLSIGRQSARPFRESNSLSSPIKEALCTDKSKRRPAGDSLMLNEPRESNGNLLA